VGPKKKGELVDTKRPRVVAQCFGEGIGKRGCSGKLARKEGMPTLKRKARLGEKGMDGIITKRASLRSLEKGGGQRGKGSH